MNDSVLIVGGGVAGVQAAIECADAGVRAILLEREAVVGGRLAAAMTDEAAGDDRGDGKPIPKLGALAGRERLELVTLAELEGLRGSPGDFGVSIRARARFVTDSCTRCNRCHAECPVVVPNAYDQELTFRKAIYTPLAQTLPDAYVIDIESCLNTPPNYLPCSRCVDACQDDSIHFDMPLERVRETRVGAVILAVGFDLADGARATRLGYGAHPDVVTSAELQRLLESPGPTGGFVAKPSNEEYPERVLMVLDDAASFAAYVAGRQMRRLAEQGIGRISCLVPPQRGSGSALGRLRALAAEAGAELCVGVMQKVEPTANDVLAVRYAEPSSGRAEQRDCDMVVLCSDVRPARGLVELAETVGVELADSGYIACSEMHGAGVATSRPGIYVAGCASGPKNVADSLAEARAAATAALGLLGRQPVQREAAPETAPRAAGAGLSEGEQRLRIEQVLYALMKLGERR